MTPTPADPPGSWWSWYQRNGGAVSLAALVAVLLSAPLIDGYDGGAVEPVLVTAALVAAVGGVGVRRRTVLTAAALAAVVVAVRWGHHAVPRAVPAAAYLASAAVFGVYAAGHHVRYVLRTRRVDANALCAGVSGYLVLGLLWAVLYQLVQAAVPGSFAVGGVRRPLAGLEPAYFSFMTLCTVGYGDLVPVSPPARTLAMAEATAGLFYVTVLLARLVAVHSAEQAARR